MQELDLGKVSFQNEEFKEINWLELTKDSELLVTIDKSFIFLLDRDGKEKNRLDWNRFDKQESDFLNKRFEVL